MTDASVDALSNELKAAHEKNAITFYHVAKVVALRITPFEQFYEDDSFDVYVSLNEKYENKKDILEKYIKKKYSSIVRNVIIETQSVLLKVL